MLKAESWGQGESVCGYVGVGGKERVQGFKKKPGDSERVEEALGTGNENLIGVGGGIRIGID
jgi:hypothetical protein